ncbi:type IV pilus twitching motility protein PilT [Enterococcus sp. BWT-B8]|uniref:type IV pilus twitching motility protein PilT n=1 Tax=unclassified Enterococcus TaxID=2608891 RepID=UPI001921B079|nr:MULTISPECIES: type IV pilus twitching motility protein PilT [unclassified Enterococcus]MCB5952533.1 type IV pilus twitching motility protein PilT [Enterococcus sp. BWT-B8]
MKQLREWETERPKKYRNREQEGVTRRRISNQDYRSRYSEAMTASDDPIRPAASASVSGSVSPKKQLDDWLRLAVEKKVSDIHLIEGVPPMFRLHGNLQPIEGMPVLYSDKISAMGESICTKKQWADFNELGEVDLAYELKNVSRFRVNIFKQMDEVAIALRQIPIEIPNLDSLGVPDALRRMIHKSQGLFLVTGPTGSGKSTTLAAMLDYLNDTKKTHVLTLEDPVEYIHNHKKSIISQREIGRDTASFSNGLRAALRQDPDVILVGEMRDFETISIALTAAETGHLVLGTLHTSSAPSTIERIVDVFPAEQQSQVRTQLAGALVGILSQRLLPTRDGKGRAAATEMLINTKGIASIIRSGKTHQISNMLQMGKTEGMHTMSGSITQLVQSQRVDAEIAESYLEEGSDF